jgi:hypothetical protein
MASADHALAPQRTWRSLTTQLLFIGLVLAFPCGIGTTGWIFRDGDTSWHVATGQWILQGGRIPNADPFSFTAAGHPWVPMEWLADILFAFAFNLAGFAGLAILVAASLIALNAVIFFYLERQVSTAVLAVTLLMLDVVLAPFVMARPHILAWPLLATWTILLLKGAEAGRPPPLWAAAILAVWTNLHGSFPLALPIAGAIGLDALTKSRWATLREWLIFGMVSLLALMLNANGVSGLLQPFRTSRLAMLPLIGEWHASSFGATPFFFAALLIGTAALLWSGKRVPLGRSLLLAVLLAMAFAHVRHQGAFMIVACCVIPPLLGSRSSSAPVPRWLLLAAVPVLAFRAAWPLTPPESEANPRQLIAAVPAELRGQRMFNSYIFGGPLILSGLKPYIDGRAEIYGDRFVAEYVNIAEGDVGAFNRAVARYDIRWTMLAMSNKPLIDRIEASGAWRRLYADGVGVIDVRTGLIDDPAAKHEVQHPADDGEDENQSKRGAKPDL